MVSWKVDGQILLGTRSEKPKIVFGIRDEKRKNLFGTKWQLQKLLFASQRVNKHVAYIFKSRFFHLHTLRHIRHTLTDDAAKTIASSLVGSRLDYANATQIGTPSKNINRLQHIQNTLARIVMKVPYAKYATWALSIYYQLALVSSSAWNRFQNCCSNLQTIVDWSAILSSM